MNIKDIFLALLIVLLWGVNFTAAKIALEELPPILFSAIRFVIIAIPAVFFISFPKQLFWHILSTGIIWGIIKFSFVYIAMNVGLSAGLASLLLQAQVLFTIALSFVLFKEHLSIAQVLGIITSIIGFSFFFFNTGGNFTLLGLVLILLAAFFWAIFNLMMKKTNIPNLFSFMVWVSLVPILPLFILSYFMENSDPVKLMVSVNIYTWLAVGYVGLIGTLFAYAIWGRLLKTYTAATITPFALLIPVSGIITSNVILGEQLESIEIMGTFLVLLGLFFCIFGNKILLKLSHN